MTTYESNSARPNVRSVHARARHALVELHHLFALLKQPEEGSHGTNVESVRTHGHQVVQQAGDLRKQGCTSNRTNIKTSRE